MGQLLGKEMFHNPLQTKNNTFLAYCSTYFSSVQNQQNSFEYSNNLICSLTLPGQKTLLSFRFSERSRRQTHIHGDRSHICRLHQSCKWLSTTGSRRPCPEVYSCCTQCPWTGRGIYRILHQHCQISPSPLWKRKKDHISVFPDLHSPQKKIQII